MNELDRLIIETVKMFKINNNTWLKQKVNEYELLIEKYKVGHRNFEQLYNLGKTMLYFNRFLNKYDCSQKYTLDEIQAVLEESKKLSTDKQQMDILLLEIDNYWFNYKWNTAQKIVIYSFKIKDANIEQVVKRNLYNGRYWQEFIGDYNKAEQIYKRVTEKLELEERVLKNQNSVNVDIEKMLLKSRFKQAMALCNQNITEKHNPKKQAIELFQKNIENFNLTTKDFNNLTCEYIELFALSYINLVNLGTMYTEVIQLKKILDIETSIRENIIYVINNNRIYDNIYKEVMKNYWNKKFDKLEIYISKIKEAYLYEYYY